MKHSIGAKLVENLTDARDGDLAKDAEFIQLLVIHRDADATGFLRDDNYWTRRGRCGVLDEVSGKEFVQNRVHLLCARGINAVGPRCDRRAARGNSYLEGEQRAGTKIGWRPRVHVGELSEDIAQLGDDGWRPTETALVKCDFAHVRRQKRFHT